MEQLKQSDFMRLMECLGHIYACTDAGAFAARVLSILPQVIPTDQVTFDQIDPVTMRITHAATPFTAPPEMLPIFEMHMHEHPWIGRLYPRERRGSPSAKQLKRKGTPLLGAALKMSDALSDGQFRRLGLYNEFYRHFRIEYQMVIPLIIDSRTLIGITFNRDRRDFSEKERLILNILGPHIVQAYRNAQAVTSLAVRAAGLQEASGTGVRAPMRPGTAMTPREREVLHYVAMGKTNIEVAMILGIAPSTVKTHLERIYEKLGVYNRTAASLLRH